MPESLIFKKLKTYKISLKDVKATFTKDISFKSPIIETPINTVEEVKDIHFHLEHELFFLTNGPLTVNLNTEKRVYEKGIVIIPAYIPHYSKSSKGNFRLLVKFDKNDHEKSSLYNPIFNFLNSQNIINLPLNENIIFYVNELDKTFDKEDGVQDEKITACFTLLLIELANSFNIKIKKDTAIETEQKYVPIINHIIHNEFDKKIDLTYIANKLYLSKKQVSRIIKKNFNCSLSELITQKKLSVACLLLTETDLPISKIISSINFETPNYFYTLFKQTYNLSPLQYRKKNKIVPPPTNKTNK